MFLTPLLLSQIASSFFQMRRRVFLKKKKKQCKFDFIFIIPLYICINKCIYNNNFTAQWQWRGQPCVHSPLNKSAVSIANDAFRLVSSLACPCNFTLLEFILLSLRKAVPTPPYFRITALFSGVRASMVRT